MIGLAGAHNTGKTTLAKAFAEKFGIPFVQGQVAQVFKGCGFDSSKSWGAFSLEDRLTVQWRVLKTHTALYQEYSSLGTAFITDRTPLDFLAYTLADIQMRELTEELERDVLAYADACFAATNAYFALVAVLQPCPEIPLVSREGRGELSMLFIEKLNWTLLGLVRDERVLIKAFSVPLSMHTLGDRLKGLHNATKVISKEHMQQAADDQMGASTATVH